MGDAPALPANVASANIAGNCGKIM